jgi:hypothetical protein
MQIFEAWPQNARTLTSRHLEEENIRLKRMYASLSLDHDLLKEVLEKKLGVDVSAELLQKS